MLIEQAGVLVRREQIQQALWQNETFVDFDQGLNYCIRQIRIALDESAEAPRMLATVPRRGYKFIAEVEPVLPEKPALASRQVAEPEPAAAGPSAEPPSTEQSSDLPRLVSSAVHRRAFHFGVAAVCGLLVVGLLLAGFHLFSSRTASQGQAKAKTPGIVLRPSVAILPFANLSARDGDAWLSTALPEMLTSELAADGRVRVASQEEVSRASSFSQISVHPSREITNHLRQQLGAEYLVFGSYTVVPDGQKSHIRIDLHVEGPDASHTPAYLTRTTDQTGILSAVSETGAGIRSALGEEILSPQQERAAGQSFPADPEARQVYAEALRLLRRFDAQAAQPKLERVTLLEPAFAPAHASLAAVFTALGYDAKAREEARRAMDAASGLPREEQLSIEARYRELAGETARAGELLKALCSFYPDSLDYGLRLANLQMQADHTADALGTVARLRRLPEPLGSHPRVDLAEAQIRAHDGDFKVMLAIADSAIRKSREMGAQYLLAQAYLQQASALERLGRPEDSLQASTQARAINTEANYPRGVAVATMLAGDVLYSRGSYPEARENYERAAGLLREIGDQKNLGLALERVGNSYHDQGKFAESGTQYTRALEIYRAIGWEGGIASATGNLANVLDAEGDLQGSLKMHREALAAFHATAQKRGEGSEVANLASVEVEAGDLASAMTHYRKGLTLHQQIAYRRGQLYAFAGVGDVLLLQGDLDGARRQYEAAMAVGREAQEANDVGRVDVSLALVDFYQHRLSEAENRLKRSLPVFEAEQDNATGALASAWLSRVLMTEGKRPEALAAGQAARMHIEKVTARGQQFEVDLAAADLAAADGQVATAARSYKAICEAAHSAGYAQYDLEARFGLLLLQPASGRNAALQRLSAEARERNFGLIATKATAALGSAVPHGASM